MTFEYIDRQEQKLRARRLLTDAQVDARRMTALYVAVLLCLDMLNICVSGDGIIPTFVSVLTSLAGAVLLAGFLLYCMAVRRGEEADYLTLFDGFSFVGKLILLEIATSALILMWSMLFIIPGIIAMYRYRFANYNLCENPDIGVLEALYLSRQQTRGYKAQLLRLDISYWGWMLLAAVPSLVHSILTSRGAVQATLDYMASPSATLPVFPESSAILPPWLWTLVGGIWMLVVSVFYLAERYCVDLAYYDIAKRTSGYYPQSPASADRWDDSNSQ